jgi:hypothetical protein
MGTVSMTVEVALLIAMVALEGGPMSLRRTQQPLGPQISHLATVRYRV